MTDSLWLYLTAHNQNRDFPSESVAVECDRHITNAATFINRGWKTRLALGNKNLSPSSLSPERKEPLGHSLPLLSLVDAGLGSDDCCN